MCVSVISESYMVNVCVSVISESYVVNVCVSVSSAPAIEYGGEGDGFRAGPLAIEDGETPDQSSHSIMELEDGLAVSSGPSGGSTLGKQQAKMPLVSVHAGCQLPPGAVGAFDEPLQKMGVDVKLHNIQGTLPRA
jgi:hypothetical protein